jgi:hypothetical protein
MCHTYPGDQFIDRKVKMTFKPLPLIDAGNQRLDFHLISCYTLRAALPNDCRKKSSPFSCLHRMKEILSLGDSIIILFLQSTKTIEARNTTGKIIVAF